MSGLAKPGSDSIRADQALGLLPAPLMRMMMPMRIGFHIRRHEYDVAMAHAPLGNHMVSECLHIRTAALQHGYFEAAFMADMNVKRRLRQVMVIVEFLRQALGQFARLVIVDIAQGR